MRSNSFEIRISNEVQSMLRFFIKSWNFQEIKSENWFSGSFSEVLWLRLVTPHELPPNFFGKWKVS